MLTVDNDELASWLAGPRELLQGASEEAEDADNVQVVRLLEPVGELVVWSVVNLRFIPRKDVAGLFGTAVCTKICVGRPVTVGVGVGMLSFLFTAASMRTSPELLQM